MDRLLYLCHRIPYPPNKGDKVRSFRILEELSRHYAVHLGAFVDDPADWQHRAVLHESCAEVHLEPLSPRGATLRSATGLLTGLPLTLPYYRSRAMARWVQHTVATHGIEKVMVFSSSMAQYLGGLPREPDRVVVDFVDADSAKWASYGARKPWPLGAIYRREGCALAAYEREIAATVDASLFVSPEEAELLLQDVPALRERVWSLPNGVDTNYFDPATEFANPYGDEERVLVFTGAMDYWPNVDAVSWFAKEVFPGLRKRFDRLSLAIVGARPTRDVSALASLPGVRVTGTVPDVRPYIKHAIAAVAPLRVARGIQNKVLEALAMSRSVIMTPEAATGLRSSEVIARLTARGEDGLAALAARLLEDPQAREQAGREGRDMVLEHYDWSRNLAPLRGLLDGTPEGPAAVAAAEVEPA